MAGLGKAVVHSNSEMQGMWIFLEHYGYELVYYICWDQFHITAKQSQSYVALMSDWVEDSVITIFPTDSFVCESSKN